MPEEGEQVPRIPEQEGLGGPEKEVGFSLERELRKLIEPLEGREPVLTNPDLVFIARRLMQPRNQAPEKLDKYLVRVEDLYHERKVAAEEAAPLVDLIDGRLEQIKVTEGSLREAIEAVYGVTEAMTRTGEAITRMARGEYRLDLPETEEGQRMFVRQLLDGIEGTSHDCYDRSVFGLVQGLEASLDNMYPEVAKEVKARLALHDSSELIKQAGGWIQRPQELPGPAIGTLAVEARRRGHDLTQEVIQTVLIDGLPDLRIAEAWDLLQAANYNYRDLVMKAAEEIRGRGEKLPFRLEDEDFRVLRDDERELGMAAANFFSDPDVARRNAVQRLLVRQLGGDKNAEKSLQLAEKLAIGSLETSVFNRTAMTGNDQLAEIIGLMGYRAGRAVPGRARGPSVHEELIPGFGESWLRRFRKKDREMMSTAERYVGDRFDVGFVRRVGPWALLDAVPKDISERKISTEDRVEVILEQVVDRRTGEEHWVSRAQGKNLSQSQWRRKTGNLFAQSWARERDIDRAFYVEDLDVSQIQEGSWEYFNTVTVTRFQELRNLIMDRKPKPLDYDKTFLQRAVVYFNTADRRRKGDKNGELRLRTLWLMGVIDEALTEVNLDWNRLAFQALRRAATIEDLSPQEGTFIRPDQWEDIRKTLNIDKRIVTLAWHRALARGLQR